MANRTTQGTYPNGSQWTKNPIPDCYPNQAYESGECKELQFPEPAPGLSGFGVVLPNNTNGLFKFNIIDKLNIPTNLEPGHYVLSFRWDCEQTSQIWISCASISLVIDADVCPTCSDGLLNGDEEEIDCGGPDCDACPTCSDGLLNGDEEDIDCGGPGCDACPTCSDGLLNGDEEDIDCGGSDCDECVYCDDGLWNGDEDGVDCGGTKGCNACHTISFNIDVNIGTKRPL